MEKQSFTNSGQLNIIKLFMVGGDKMRKKLILFLVASSLAFVVGVNVKIIDKNIVNLPNLDFPDQH